jgi:hypothetical protein
LRLPSSSNSEHEFRQRVFHDRSIGILQEQRPLALLQNNRIGFRHFSPGQAESAGRATKPGPQFATVSNSRAAEGRSDPYIVIIATQEFFIEQSRLDPSTNVRLLRLKKLRPELIQPKSAIRSIPDWLILKSEMRIPFDRYKLVWVGEDGTVQLCYMTFKLGNLHERRLADILFTPEHREAARVAFQLKCPNRHCGSSTVESSFTRLAVYVTLRWGH